MLRVEAVTDHAKVSQILDRYADLPCDYADASLIELAERTGVAAIATIDQGDFSIYRLRDRKRFRILLPSERGRVAQPDGSVPRATAQTFSWPPGVEREIFNSSSVISAGTSAKSGVLR